MVWLAVDLIHVQWVKNPIKKYSAGAMVSSEIFEDFFHLAIQIDKDQINLLNVYDWILFILCFHPYIHAHHKYGFNPKCEVNYPFRSYVKSKMSLLIILIELYINFCGGMPPFCSHFHYIRHMHVDSVFVVTHPYHFWTLHVHT